MPKHRHVEMSLVGNLRLLADDPKVTSVRWGEDDRELVLREGRYVVEVLKRRNRLLPVTVFSTLAERMVQHGFVWTDSRLVEGDVEHVFKMENTKKDPSSPYGPPVESGRHHAEFALARRRVSSTKLVDAIACRPWPGQYPGSSPEGSDDELASFIGEARTDSGEEGEMVTQLERNLQSDASGSFRSGFVSHGSPEDAVYVDMPVFVMGQPETKNQEEVRQTVRAGAHEETASGVWMLSPEEVLDSNIPSSEVGNVPVLEEGEDEELLRKMLTAHRQEGRVLCRPVVHESTEPKIDVITSIAQEEEEEEAMKLMTSSPGIPFIPYDETLESHDVKRREDMPIIIQEEGFPIQELCWTYPGEKDLDNAEWIAKQEEKSPSFLTQLLTEHQTLHLEYGIPKTGAPYSDEIGLASPSPNQLLEEPPTAILPAEHNGISATQVNSTASFKELMGFAEDSHDLISEECDTKRRRTENTWATVKRVDLVEARTASDAYSPHTDRYRQRQSADRQPAIAPTAAYKLVEELLENAARTRQCDEVSNIVTDNSDTVVGDKGASPQLSSTVLREDIQASHRHCDEAPSVFVYNSGILVGDGDLSPQLYTSVHQQFHEKLQAPRPATTTELAVRNTPSLQALTAVTSAGMSPEEDSNSQTVTEDPTTELCVAIAELVDTIIDEYSQPDPKNARDNQAHPHITTAAEEKDTPGCHGDQVCWDHPPDFSTLRAIWLEDWPVDHWPEQGDVSENLK